MWIWGWEVECRCRRISGHTGPQRDEVQWIGLGLDIKRIGHCKAHSLPQFLFSVHCSHRVDDCKETALKDLEQSAGGPGPSSDEPPDMFGQQPMDMETLKPQSSK